MFAISIYFAKFAFLINLILFYYHKLFIKNQTLMGNHKYEFTNLKKEFTFYKKSIYNLIVINGSAFIIDYGK
ncbi:hypothetical protein AAX19_06090 [Oenococcus oeni]|nr:hypothetical protein AAX19_06090 [Oenococcus oeni]